MALSDHTLCCLTTASLRSLLRSRVSPALCTTLCRRRAFSLDASSSRSGAVLDSWVAREARPISLRQLSFFGRSLTESRLLSSANYVRNELPTRLAHRLRDLQTLPYSAVKNPHISHVYELYYAAFDKLRQFPEIRSLEQNDAFCKIIKDRLLEHLTVIPRLATGILQVQDFLRPEDCDRLMTTLLRSRISRRVIGEQHIALTDTFHSLKSSSTPTTTTEDSIGQVLLKCHARETIEKCAATIRGLLQQTYGATVPTPEIEIEGHLETTFPYIPSHLEYIIGELLRNSMQAVMAHKEGSPAPIKILICESPDHVIIRVSDQGGGIARDIKDTIWSFASKGPRRESSLRNLEQVPRLVGSMQELSSATSPDSGQGTEGMQPEEDATRSDASLSSFTSRPPNLRLGLGLPLSKVYAEYWAGKLEVQNLEGYGTDAFLQLSKFGNRNETLTTRASMDGV